MVVRTVFFCGASAMLLLASLRPRQDPQLLLEQVTEGVHVVLGQGGNVTVLAGEDGVLLVDAKFAVSGRALKARIKEVSQAPVRWLLNTHHHGDHTDGNKVFAGEPTRIVGHENVRKRLLAEGRTPPPEVTFAEALSIQAGDVAVEVWHPGPGHTDNDSVVLLREPKVLVMGDLLFNGMHPFVLPAHGASMRAWITALDRIGERYGTIAGLKVVPGHGPVCGIEGLAAMKTYFADLLAAMGTARKAGKDLTTAIKEAEELRAKYAGWKGERFRANLEAAFEEAGS
jgi:glyoxylase-like metal-dependent hydrolase (beta-lactamase superfamily II)